MPILRGELFFNARVLAAIEFSLREAKGIKQDYGGLSGADSFGFTLFQDKEGRAFIWSSVKSKGVPEPEVTHDGGAVAVKIYLRNGKALGQLRPRGNSFICPSPVTRV